MGDVQTVRGGVAGAVPGPVFVDVIAPDGTEHSVPAEWVGNSIFDKGFTVVEPDDQPAPAPAPVEVSEVQVTGTPSEESLIPAVRDAVEEHAAAVAEAAAPDAVVSERSTHEEIDAYAEAHGIDLGDAANGTKAEKLAVIENTTDTDGTEPADENPPSGEEK